MRILGLEFRRAGSPIKAAGSAFEARSHVNAIMAAKLSGYNPRSFSATVQAEALPNYVPQSRRQPDATGLYDRAIATDTWGDWLLNSFDKLEPKQVAALLRGALAGNLWQQYQITVKMLDSWPMFRKCAAELRSAVAASRFVVHPYAAPGQEPAKRAKAKADLVSRALDGFRPNRFSDEEGKSGMVYDLTHAILDGVSITEMLWDKTSAPDGGIERLPRASAWVHPLHYSFLQNGTIGLTQQSQEDVLGFPLQLAATGAARYDQREAKYLVAKFKSKSGSVLGAGFSRVLAYYWCTIMYGRDFLTAFAQKHGSPFLDIAYAASVKTATDIDKFEQLAKRAANQNYIVHPDTGKVEVKPAQSLSGENPIVRMIQMADEACQMLLLGQTLTSTAPINGGTRAQGDVHKDVRDQRIEEHARWIATILTEQFAESLLQVNYGESSERPTVEVDMTRPLSATEKGTLLQNISNSRVPVPVEPAYKLLDLPVPQPGDKVLVGGEHLIMEEAVTPTEKREQQFEEQMAQAEAADQFQQMQASLPALRNSDFMLSGATLRARLAKATPKQLASLKAATLKAKAAAAAGHLNGEMAELKTTLSRL